MKKEIIDYINSQPVCVLAVEMLDGSPHAATVHFAFDAKSKTFFFKTHKGYRKTEPLLAKDSVRATVVVGFDEKEMKTFQADGVSHSIITESEKNLFNEVFYAKFTNKTRNDNDSEAVYVSFTPIWWRFTDWKTPKGKKIISSEDK